MIKTKYIVFLLVTLWALMIAFITLLLFNVWSVKPATSTVAGEYLYKVDHINYGDLILFNPDDRNDNFIVTMEQAFPYKLDAMPHDLITVYVDDQDNIIHMERTD